MPFFPCCEIGNEEEADSNGEAGPPGELLENNVCGLFLSGLHGYFSLARSLPGLPRGNPP